MAGGSKQTQKTEQQSNPWAPAQPALQQQVQGAQSWMNSPLASATYSGPRVAAMSDLTQQGINGFANPTGAQGAMDYLTKQLNGGFTDYNSPYMQDLRRSIESSVMPGVNATFAKAGMFGSTTNQAALARGLSDGMAAPMAQLYENERQRQQQAATLLPQLEQGINQNRIQAGQLGEGYTQRQYDADRAAFEEQRMAGLRPYLDTLPITTAIGGMGGTQSGTTTTTQRPSTASMIGGGLMAGAGLMAGMPGLGMAGAGGGLFSGMGMFGGNAPMGSLPWQSGYSPAYSMLTGNYSGR